MIEPGQDVARAWRVAKACGVTRLGELTRLDRIGAPVFHAIRPASRALCTHQGKGLTREAAMLGALMEAVESDHAERFQPERLKAPFVALSRRERSPRRDDFAASRKEAPDEAEPLAWVEARRLVDGGRLWVPFDAVSLDYTRPGDRRLDRASHGLAAHFDRDAAITTALLEVIERDALAAWRAQGLIRRSSSRLSPAEIDYPWFLDLAARIEAAGLTLSLYELPAVIPFPALMAEIVEPDAEGATRAAVFGTACHPSAERALEKSLLEALQSRLTAVAGARDDILPGEGGETHAALPPSFALQSRSWKRLAERNLGPRPGRPDRIAEALADAGYPGAAIVDLSRPGLDAAVVKAVVPGLGAEGRARRRPDHLC